MQEETIQSSAGPKAETQLVTFLLKDEEFGFDIMSVQEIIRLPKMARVPRTPAYVEGIANLRGVVLPVIDMRTRFGIEQAEATDRTRVLVIDIAGVKTGLRVDRVKQVTRVLASEIEPPPRAIHGTTSDYIEGVAKLDNGQRIVMALNATQVCDVGAAHRPSSENGHASAAEALGAELSAPSSDADAEVHRVVTFRIAKEEFAFHMEHVREILRVQTPNQVPDVPDYVLGVLTVRGQILPVLDLRRLLQQRSLAEEFADTCRPLRVEYEGWIDQTEKALADGSQPNLACSVMERVRKWIADTNSSSELLMEALAKARGLNESVLSHIKLRTKCIESRDRDAERVCGQSILSASREAVDALKGFEHLVAQNIHEDQRIIVVDSEGLVIGLVVDHVHEVLNVPKNLMEPPPRITSSGGMELSGIAKLNDGSRLIMLLDVANLMKDQTIRHVTSSANVAREVKATDIHQGAAEVEELSEIQLVTFMLGEEEFGIPISQIQEIDRIGKITKVPRAAQFIEGITNLRGEVIPVLDTRKRFELPTRPSDDRTRIIIVDLKGVKTGLVVDSVREVLNLGKRDIAPPPGAIGSGLDQQFISGIGKVDAGKRMIVLLNVERILSAQEQALLSEISQAD